MAELSLRENIHQLSQQKLRHFDTFYKQQSHWKHIHLLPFVSLCDPLASSLFAGTSLGAGLCSSHVFHHHRSFVLQLPCKQHLCGHVKKLQWDKAFTPSLWPRCFLWGKRTGGLYHSHWLKQSKQKQWEHWVQKSLRSLSGWRKQFRCIWCDNGRQCPGKRGFIFASVNPNMLSIFFHAVSSSPQ